MKMGIIQAITLAGLMTFVLSACVSSNETTSKSTGQPAAPWAQNLNEPPPSRPPAGDPTSRLKADVNAAREKASR
jgi:hypothetical protein